MKYNNKIMEQNNENRFVVLPNEVVDCEEISPKSLVVYCAIKQHMDKDTLEAFPGIKTIAKESGCGEDAVRKAIKELVDNKFIEQKIRQDKALYINFLKQKVLSLFHMIFLRMIKLKSEKKLIL